MKTVLLHYVVMEKYEIPDNIAKKTYDQVERYIYEKHLEPYNTGTRDYEIVEIY